MFLKFGYLIVFFLKFSSLLIKFWNKNFFVEGISFFVSNILYLNKKWIILSCICILGLWIVIVG